MTASSLRVPGSGTVAPASAPGSSNRLVALDWMRGLVMVLMTIDHASAAFNAGRFTADAARRWTGGLELPAAQFLTRWVTHLCAPTFLFLAGAALALSTQRRLEAGESPRSVDGFHLRRGLFIVLLDPLWMSWALKEPGYVILQVLYVLGMGMMCMVPLRRLGARTLLGLGLVLPAANEAFIRWLGAETSPSVLEALLVNLGVFAGGRVVIGYPLLPWLGMMCLGWAFGRRLLESRTGVTRLLVGAGVAMLGVFVLVRGLNGYGNMGLYREGGSLLKWLHVSKYPPSLSFAALELGLMALLLAGFWWVEARWGEVRALAPLKLLGQTALFFYLLHVHLLQGAALLLGVRKQLGLGATYGAAVVALGVLCVACSGYRRYKAAHPGGWTRYV